MCARVSRGRHAPARARRQPSLRAFAQSVSRRALSAYCVPGPCWLLGLPWEPTRAHAELREERRSPLNPGRGAARHTRGCGPARPSGACAPGSAWRPRPPTPTYLPSPGHGNSDPSLVPTSSRFSPPSDAECNPCIFSDWSKKEKKKSSFTRRAFTSHGKVCYTRCSGGPSLGGATANPGLPKRWLSASGTPGQAQSSACGTRGQPLSWMTDKSSRFTVLAKSQGTLLPAWTTANSYGGQGPPPRQT